MFFDSDTWVQFSSVQFSCSVVSDSLQPHGLQHARTPCPSPTPRTYSNSCSCHPTIILCYPLILPPSVFASIRVLSNESVLPIRWPKYWSFSFSISPSNEYSGLISINIIYYLKPFPVPATLAFPPSFKQAANQNPSSLEPRANAATV